MSDRLTDIRVKLSMSTGDTADDIAFLLDERDEEEEQKNLSRQQWVEWDRRLEATTAERDALRAALTDIIEAWEKRDKAPPIEQVKALIPAIIQARATLARGEIGVEPPPEGSE